MVRQLCSNRICVCDVELFKLSDLGDINDDVTMRPMRAL